MGATLPGQDDGHFPFGAANTPRPVRPPASGRARQLVIGTYPSALHVGWRAPAFLTLPSGATGKVASLAVDVEPIVFWDGKDASERVERWADQVGFVVGDDRGCHGHLTKATNGPSGDSLIDDYFPGLPVAIADTAFIDVLPVFFVKPGTAARRGQADVMEHEYNAVAAELGLPIATLPLRPSPAELPALALQLFGPWLQEVVLELKPEHVVTLGEEALAVTQQLVTTESAHPMRSLKEAAAQSRYGASVGATLGEQPFAWTALAHPGAIRQSKGVRGGWAEVHEAWLQR